jgi:hypothetical protein
MFDFGIDDAYIGAVRGEWQVVFRPLWAWFACDDGAIRVRVESALTERSGGVTIIEEA